MGFRSKLLLQNRSNQRHISLHSLMETEDAARLRIDVAAPPKPGQMNLIRWL
jgi:hypothetical protein